MKRGAWAMNFIYAKNAVEVVYSPYSNNDDGVYENRFTSTTQQFIRSVELDQTKDSFCGRPAISNSELIYEYYGTSTQAK